MPRHDPIIDRAQRDDIRESLEQLLPSARALEAHDVIESIYALLAVLDSPGVLRQSALLPLMITFHERVADMFDRAADAGYDPEDMRIEAELARQDGEEARAILDATRQRTS